MRTNTNNRFKNIGFINQYLNPSWSRCSLILRGSIAWRNYKMRRYRFKRNSLSLNICMTINRIIRINIITQFIKKNISTKNGNSFCRNKNSIIFSLITLTKFHKTSSTSRIHIFSFISRYMSIG